MALGNQDSFDSFPTTHWSLVEQAGANQGEAQRVALTRLVHAYEPAMRAYLMRQGRLSRDEADDRMQGFFASKIVGGDFLTRARQARGRFRNYLRTSLRNFCSNQNRHDRLEPAASPLTEEAAALDGDPGAAFDLAWARGVLSQAVDRMRDDCRATARPDVWAVFEGRVLGPTMLDRPPVDYQELVQQCGLISPVQASNILVTAKRMFVRALRSVVGTYESSDDEIDLELADLQKIVAESARKD